MAPQVHYPKLLCLGDSLTECAFDVDAGRWACILASRFKRQVDVVVRGFSGYTSRQGKFLLPRLLQPGDGSSLAALIVWFGANDACLPGVSRFVPLDEYAANLNAMVDYGESCGVLKSKIILVSPPIYNHEAWAEVKAKEGISKSDLGRADGRALAYAQRCAQVANLRETGFVDIHAKMEKRQDWQELLIDGLHFNSTGAAFVASAFSEALDPLIKHLPAMFPTSDRANFENPEKQLSEWQPSS